MEELGTGMLRTGGTGDRDALYWWNWGQGCSILGELGQGCSALDEGTGDRDALHWRSWDRDAPHWGNWDRDAPHWRNWGQGCSAAGARGRSGAAQPCGEPRPRALSLSLSLEGLSPRAGLSWCSGPGSGPASGSQRPRHSPAVLVLSTASAPAGSAAPPSRPQTLPGAKSCSIYWPQAELTAAG